jgi:uncharacterized protein (DUF1810 family)
MNDPDNLQRSLLKRFLLERFLDAQKHLYHQARAELEAGRKTSHWMWFIFPQIQGLGSSELARRYAISSIEEARAYVEHPVLGTRLRECTRLVNRVEKRPIEEIFPYPDDLKFRSSMTLFARAAADNAVFLDALNKYFGGEFDRKTLERL